jgi:hypothetical protein
MKRAFAGDCELEMAVRTDAISFPSSAKGLEQIAQVLVTNFGDQYENVRTFCLSRPNSDYPPYFRCDWLVGMSARQGGAVRVGCGHYGWHFGSDNDRRVKKLAIDIEVVCVLPAEGSKPIMQWLPVCHILGVRTSKLAKVFQLLMPCNQSKASSDGWKRATRPSLEGDERLSPLRASLQTLLRNIDRRQIDRCAYVDVSRKNREWKVHQAPRCGRRLASVG